MTHPNMSGHRIDMLSRAGGIREGTGGREASMEMDGGGTISTVSRSAPGMEKANSRDITPQKGLAWGYLKEQGAKGGGWKPQRTQKSGWLSTSGLVGDQSGF